MFTLLKHILESLFKERAEATRTISLKDYMREKLELEKRYKIHDTRARFNNLGKRPTKKEFVGSKHVYN